MVIAPQVCDPGFTPDNINEYCYMVINSIDVQVNAASACSGLTPSGAQLLSFENEAQVEEFMIMLKIGTTFVLVSIQYWKNISGDFNLSYNFFYLKKI